MDLAATLAEINTLPVADRIRLVQAIWDAIPEADCEPDLSDAQKTDLDRRLADLRANPDTVMTWDEIKDYVRWGRPK